MAAVLSGDDVLNVVWSFAVFLLESAVFATLASPTSDLAAGCGIDCQ